MRLWPRVHAVMTVPAFPLTAKVAFSIEVIITLLPPRLTKSQAASIFWSH